MTQITLPAFAKLNLGLRVLGRRQDGFHELRTVFQTISLHDTLRFEGPAQRLSVICRAEGVPGGEENLVHRAALAFERAARRAPRVKITLQKRIPTKAGLGGGSTDAAVTLLALNALSGHPLRRERLAELGAGLGSDVPFFLTGGTALGLGRGEILRPLRDLSPLPILILAPDFGVSTVEAFRRLDSTLTPEPGQISIYRFSRQWVRGTGMFTSPPNDLERAVAPPHSRLARLLATLRGTGASEVAMTGSGSAAYGVYEGETKAHKALDRLSRSSAGIRVWLVRTIGAAEYAARVLDLEHERRNR